MSSILQIIKHLTHTSLHKYIESHYYYYLFQVHTNSADKIAFNLKNYDKMN